MTDYSQTFIDLGYIAASILFIVGIKMLGKQERARMGNLMSALGMLVRVTQLSHDLVVGGVLERVIDRFVF